MRTERQQQAINEVKAFRKGITHGDSPYSIEATAAGTMPWWHKMHYGYVNARWPCSPWWREFIRCVVRTI